MLQQALEAIREAEQQASLIVSEGRRKAAEIGENATRALKALEEKAAKEKVDRRKTLLAEAETRGRSEAVSIADESHRRIEELRADASSRMDTAVAEVIKRVIE